MKEIARRALRGIGGGAYAHVREAYDAVRKGYMSARVRGRALHRPVPGKIIVCGYFSDPRGVAQGAYRSAEALEAGGFPVVRHDIGPLLTGAMPAPPPGSGGVLLLHANPPELEALLRNWPAGAWANRYRIGYWVWELPTPPASWANSTRWVDEIWTPSKFSGDALAQLAGARGKIAVAPHPLPIGKTPAKRALFGIGADDVAVLMAFDFRSSRARKNPDGALSAYLAAFPQPRDGVRLIVKALAPEADPDGAAALTSAPAARLDITVMTEVLSQADTDALVASIDIMLSLHRSEGFGLMPAQAMMQGKAVIATGWSGVMEFMTGDVAELVPYHMTDVNDPSGIYAQAGAQWAEPDIIAASQSLRRLVEDADYRRALGDRARARACDLFTHFEQALSPRAQCWIAL